MKHFRITLTALCVLLPAIRAASELPPAPNVSLSQGRALVSLVREAMERYRRFRTPVKDHPVPEALKPLLETRYPVAVVLRSEGRAVATSQFAAAATPHNAVAAALDAMRSPRLPDRVTSEVLAALRVEVEVLGPATPLPEDPEVGPVAPGRTGLRATRGKESGYVLPSTAYILDFSPGQIRRYAIAQVPLTSGNRDAEPRFERFLTRHFLGYPGRKPLALYRGKLLLPMKSIRAEDLRAASIAAGGFLVTHQDRESGRYETGEGDPALEAHLYAAWAMGRLARRTGSPTFGASLNAALGYATGKIDTVLPHRYLKTADPDDQLETAAMFLLASRLSDQKGGAELRDAVAEAMIRAIRPDGRFSSRLDGPRQTPAPLGASAKAYIALRTGGYLDEPTAGRVEKALAALRPEGPTGALWALRANLPAPWVRLASARSGKTPLLPTTLCGSGAMDEEGGFGLPGEPPRTLWTALQALVTARAIAPYEAKMGEGSAAEERAEVLAARRFCYRMLYRPREAYWTAEPDKWVGGVRATPAGAKVTLPACAAAIEAFLLRTE